MLFVERRFGTDLVEMTDLVACPDGATADRLREAGAPATTLAVTGNPTLEEIWLTGGLSLSLPRERMSALRAANIVLRTTSKPIFAPRSGAVGGGWCLASKLDPPLRRDTLLVRVLYQLHLGHQIGGVHELWRRAPSGQHEV
jgi:hypothetical protein